MSCTISRNGDLVSDVFVEVVLTKRANAQSTWWPAEALIKEVELEIGGQRIDKHNATFFRIFNELFRKDDDKKGYERLVDFTADEKLSTNAITRRFYVPLIFFFNRNPGLALPLIALTAGQNSTLPRASGHCARENQLNFQGALCSPSQVLVSCA